MCVCLYLPDMMRRLKGVVNEKEREKEGRVRNANEMTEGKKVRKVKKLALQLLFLLDCLFFCDPSRANEKELIEQSRPMASNCGGRSLFFYYFSFLCRLVLNTPPSFLISFIHSPIPSPLLRVGWS